MTSRTSCALGGAAAVSVMDIPPRPAGLAREQRKGRTMTDFDVPPRPTVGTTGTPTPITTTGGGVQDQLDQGVAAAKAQAGPLVEKARGFAKSRPWTAAALAGVVGLAVLNTLRGRR